MNTIEIKKQVCSRLGITEFEYDREVFESGVQFVEDVIGENEQIKNIISYSEKFWTWWRNQFMIADLKLLDSGINRLEWLNYHTAKNSIVYLPDAIFEETYAKLINEINKTTAVC
jgi:hypothetical protein